MRPMHALLLTTAILISGCAGLGGPAGGSALASGRAASPSSGSGDLLYVTYAGRLRHGSGYAGWMKVLTFPQGAPYATNKLKGLGNGLCSDASGNVWAVEGANNNWSVDEFAHGGTKPIAKLHIPEANYNASGCAIDPTTGNLAVLTGYYDGSGTRAYVYVWPGARSGRPASYGMNFTPQDCAYDASGDLFIDGYVGSTIFFVFAELAQGSSTVANVKLNEYPYGYPGGVGWDGKYVDVVTATRRSGGPAILQLRVSGNHAHVAHIVHLNGLYFMAQFVVTGNQVVANSGDYGQEIALWQYPAGGDPVATVAQLRDAARGMAISAGSVK